MMKVGRRLVIFPSLSRTRSQQKRPKLGRWPPFPCSSTERSQRFIAVQHSSRSLTRSCFGIPLGTRLVFHVFAAQSSMRCLSVYSDMAFQAHRDWARVLRKFTRFGGCAKGWKPEPGVGSGAATPSWGDVAGAGWGREKRCSQRMSLSLFSILYSLSIRPVVYCTLLNILEQ